MELIGITIGAMAGLVAAPAFCFALVRLTRDRPVLGRRLAVVGLLAMVGVTLDLAIVGLWSAEQAQRIIGAAFYPAQVALSLAAPPAVAGALLGMGRRVRGWWPAVAALAWAVGVCCMFFLVDVSEALFGVDGSVTP